MPTHGKARETTIGYLRNLTPFQRKGYAMSGVEGKWNGTGRLSGDDLSAYYAAENVKYTVLSYGTPIAWVTSDATVIPETTYSRTTSQHQGLCRTYLNR